VWSSRRWALTREPWFPPVSNVWSSNADALTPLEASVLYKILYARGRRISGIDAEIGRLAREVATREPWLSAALCGERWAWSALPDWDCAAASYAVRGSSAP